MQVLSRRRQQSQARRGIDPPSTNKDSTKQGLRGLRPRFHAGPTHYRFRVPEPAAGRVLAYPKERSSLPIPPPLCGSGLALDDVGAGSTTRSGPQQDGHLQRVAVCRPCCRESLDRPVSGQYACRVSGHCFSFVAVGPGPGRDGALAHGFAVLPPQGAPGRGLHASPLRPASGVAAAAVPGWRTGGGRQAGCAGSRSRCPCCLHKRKEHHNKNNSRRRHL